MAVSIPQLGQVFQSAGFSPAGAAGVIGNLQQESSLNPNAPGGGLAQWQGSRYSALQSFAQSQGKSAADPIVQASFLVNEIKTQYPGLYNTLRTTNDPKAAALAVSQQYERPGIPMNQNRENYAASALGQLGGKASGSPSFSMPGASGTGTTQVTVPAFNQAGFNQAQAKYIAGMAVQQASGSSNPFNTSPGSSKGFASSFGGASSNPLLASKGLLTTSAPSQADFETTQTMTVAQNELQKLAGVPLATHPASSQSAGKILNMALSVLGGPYNQATHSSALTESAAQIKKTGTDCSGFVSWLMGPDGLGIWKQALATPDIPNAPGIQKGAGKQITIYNNPLPGNSGHVFIQIDGKFFQSAGGGAGIQAISPQAAQQMIQNGDNGAPYTALHPKGF